MKKLRLLVLLIFVASLMVLSSCSEESEIFTQDEFKTNNGEGSEPV